MKLIYYGKATNLRVEVRQTLGRKVHGIQRGDAAFRHDIEALGLKLLVNNTFNKKERCLQAYGVETIDIPAIDALY
jgi:hypothetical protein